MHRDRCERKREERRPRDEFGGGDDKQGIGRQIANAMRVQAKSILHAQCNAKLHECLTPELDACAAWMRMQWKVLFLRARGKAYKIAETHACHGLYLFSILISRLSRLLSYLA
jgi:hypothetical protein